MERNIALRNARASVDAAVEASAGELNATNRRRVTSDECVGRLANLERRPAVTVKMHSFVKMRKRVFWNDARRAD